MATMTDDAIVARLTYAAGQAVGFSESKLAKEREKVRLAYDGLRPERVSAGDSGYTSLDVYDAVESMKAQLLEVVSASHRPLTFQPAEGEPEEAAAARTDWCSHVLFGLNHGFSVLQTALDDGLMGRVGVVKVWWDKAHKTEVYDLADTTLQELQAHLADAPDAEVEDYTLHEDGVGIKRVRLSVKKDRSQVRLEAVPPEEFGISPMAKDGTSAEVVFHRRRLTISELLKMGYPKAKVLDLQDDERLWEGSDSDRYQRFQPTDDMIGEDNPTSSKARNRCMVVEAYTELDLNETGESLPYKITYVGNTILDKERVERRPFAYFAPLPRSHAFWGNNYAKQVMATQTARTYLTRSIINHALVTNNPRLAVVRGAVLNPRELMENRIGGIVNVTRPDGIQPIPQQGLNPFIFQTIAMLDDGKEQLTGISRLSQGLNKDAISTQNSQGMVQDLITASQTRQKVIARNFVENFLRSLYTQIYQLTLENEDRGKIMRASGKWVPVDFTDWPEDATLEVNPTLGYGEAQKEAMKWLGYDKTMAGDPSLAPFYPKEKRFNVLKKAMEATGMKNITDYILTPDQIQPPQPTPMMLADLEAKKADAAVKRANAEAAKLNIEMRQQVAADKKAEFYAKLQLQAHKEENHEAHLQDQLAHKVAVDASGLRLSIQALERDKLTASTTPSG